MIVSRLAQAGAEIDELRFLYAGRADEPISSAMVIGVVLC